MRCNISEVKMINEVNNKPDFLTPVERQLDAYNAKEIIPFTAQFSDDIEVFRPPNPESVIKEIKDNKIAKVWFYSAE